MFVFFTFNFKRNDNNMNPIQKNRIDCNIPVNLSLGLKIKEAIHAFFKRPLIVKLFTYLPSVYPFEKYKALAQLITKCHQVFNSINHSSLEVKIYGGDKLKTLQEFEKTLNKPVSFEPEITYVLGNSLQAARRMRLQLAEGENPRIAILNLANRWQPGGVGLAPYGGSQEEFLIRRSNLAWGLDPQFTLGKKVHSLLRSLRIQEGYAEEEAFEQHIPYFGTVLCKNVTFIDKEEPDHFDVISAAAPDMRKGADEYVYIQKYGKQAKEVKLRLMEDKIRAIFATAVAENIEHLVLGAFGCGCFENDSREVAQIFSKVLQSPRYKGKFRHITFAITEKSKLDIFRNNAPKGVLTPQ
jgi:uncharacterized protein (TIGR02452 family)